MPANLRSPFLFVCLAALAGCASETRSQLARDAAGSVVNRVVVDRYPELPVATAIDCVLANGSRPELNALASNTVTGATPAAIETVDVILHRQETRQCLVDGGADLPV